MNSQPGDGERNRREKQKKGKKEMNDDGRTSKDTRHEKKGGEERNVKKVKRYGT